MLFNVLCMVCVYVEFLSKTKARVNVVLIIQLLTSKAHRGSLTPNVVGYWCSKTQFTLYKYTFV